LLEEVRHNISPCVKAGDDQRTRLGAFLAKKMSNRTDKIAMLRRHPETIRRNDSGVAVLLCL
jgi:hypothetical protein